MRQPVGERGRHLGVTEDTGPFEEAYPYGYGRLAGSVCCAAERFYECS
jgi:hypothetical protein